jgi:hypothetical protein
MIGGLMDQAEQFNVTKIVHGGLLIRLGLR